MGQRTTVEGIVGNGRAGLSDGSEEAIRLTRDANQVVANGHGAWFELASRKKLYSASVGAAGVAPGTALSATPAFALFNPPNSGYAAVLKDCTLGYVSGTLGAGSIVYAQGALSTAAPANFLTTMQSAQINGVQAPGAAVVRAYSNVSLTTVPTILRPAFMLGAALATTPNFPITAKDNIDGEFILLPGAFFAVHGIAAAGTAPLVIIAMSWYELPLAMIDL